MDFLRNTFGNLVSGVIRLLVTVGILAAAYFFIVKPVLETTETISGEANSSIQKSFEASGFDDIDDTLDDVNRQVERQLKHALSTSKRQGNVARLRRCVEHANQNVRRVQRCARRY
jgi:hypothetical protein